MKQRLPVDPTNIGENLPSKNTIQHISSITHEGKVIAVATDTEGHVFYTVKQDGFEDNYLEEEPEERNGWEPWEELVFPNEPTEDPSVRAKESEKFSTYGESYVVSQYQTLNDTAVAPVQLVSALGFLYVFRQSKKNSTLLVDRFVLDGMTNRLNPKLEIRFKRSRQKYKPYGNQKIDDGRLLNEDSLDYRDMDNEFFYEPTTELKYISYLHKGYFSVVFCATNEHEKYRWHIFAYNKLLRHVRITTIRASEDGLFDPKDYVILEPKDETDSTLIPRNIPGIIEHQLSNFGKPLAENIGGLSATLYNIQQEVEIKSNVSFAAIKDIIDSNCANSSCHGGTITPDFRIDDNITSFADRIRQRTGNKTMPPSSSGNELDDETIETIACWVADNE